MNTSSQYKKILFFILMFFVFAIFFYIFFYKHFLIYIFLLLIFFVILLKYSINNFYNIFPIFIFLILILPLKAYAKYPVVVGINDYVISGGLLLLLGVTFFYNFILINKYKNEKIYIPKVFLIYVLIVMYFFVLGFFKGYKFTWILRESMGQFMYFIPFLILIKYYEKSRIKMLINLLSLATIIIAIEYIARYYWGILHLSLYRVITRQANLVVFVFPIVYFSIFSKEPKKIKTILLRILILFFTIFLTLISLQRTLWGIILFNILAGFVYYLILNKFSAKSVMYVLIIIISIILIMTIFILIIQNYIDIIRIIRVRLGTLQSSIVHKDVALNVRMEDNKKVLKLIQKDYYLGSGFGASIFQKNTGINKETIDNSYLIILYKTGIIGFFVLIFIYLRYIYFGIRLWIKNISDWYVLALIFILINYLIMAGLSSALLYYRFNLLIGIVFVYLDLLNRQRHSLNKI